ncbi:hypothetical protein BT96DRAFT_947997 [Gymnopus androsaceus JB14]|uniref:Uncharacterized protein n=1 Tax=Gymnopus androsaceus JB14 TaxID=1447944 RepID=A0A6A4GRR3_9AGAR|nr:hypothetical protein BT96DRAFT_947997 [Gymnopus androsaceus JB14]
MKVYVHSGKGGELGMRAIVRNWVGFNGGNEDNVQSQGHRIHWKGKNTVTIEWLVSFASMENGGLDVKLKEIEVEAEGENEEESLPPIKNSLNPKSGSTPVTPNPAKSNSLTTEQPMEIAKNTLTSMSTRPVHACFPSCYIHNLCSGTGYTSGRDTIP